MPGFDFHSPGLVLFTVVAELAGAAASCSFSLTRPRERGGEHVNRAYARTNGFPASPVNTVASLALAWRGAVGLLLLLLLLLRDVVCGQQGAT